MENGQGMEVTRNHAICTTVEGSTCVYLQREDSGGRSSMKTAGKYMKIRDVEKTFCLVTGIQEGHLSGRVK